MSTKTYKVAPPMANTRYYGEPLTLTLMMAFNRRPDNGPGSLIPC